MSDVELKPCPFCGGPATQWANKNGTLGQAIWCQNSVTCGGELSLEGPEPDAITAWNTRAQADEVGRLRTQLIALRAEIVRQTCAAPSALSVIEISRAWDRMRNAALAQEPGK